MGGLFGRLLGCGPSSQQHGHANTTQPSAAVHAFQEQSHATSTAASLTPVGQSPARDWLQQLGLGQYADAFELCGYDDLLQLSQLDDADLDAIQQRMPPGSTLLPGHRKKLLLASRQLTADGGTQVYAMSAYQSSSRGQKTAGSLAALGSSSAPDGTVRQQPTPVDAGAQILQGRSTTSTLTDGPEPTGRDGEAGYSPGRGAGGPTLAAAGARGPAAAGHEEPQALSVSPRQSVSRPSPERKRWNIPPPSPPAAAGMAAGSGHSSPGAGGPREPRVAGGERSPSPRRSAEGLWAASPAADGAAGELGRVPSRQLQRQRLSAKPSQPSEAITVTSIEDPFPPGVILSPTGCAGTANRGARRGEPNLDGGADGSSSNAAGSPQPSHSGAAEAEHPGAAAPSVVVPKVQRASAPVQGSGGSGTTAEPPQGPQLRAVASRGNSGRERPSGVSRSASNASSSSKRPASGRVMAVPTPSKSAAWDQDFALCIEGRPYKAQPLHADGADGADGDAAATCASSRVLLPSDAEARGQAEGAHGNARRVDASRQQPGAVVKKGSPLGEPNQMEVLPPERNPAAPHRPSSAAGGSPATDAAAGARAAAAAVFSELRPQSAAASTVGNGSLTPSSSLHGAHALQQQGSRGATSEARGTTLTAWLPSMPASTAATDAEPVDEDEDLEVQTESATELLDQIKAVLRGLARVGQGQGQGQGQGEAAGGPVAPSQAGAAAVAPAAQAAATPGAQRQGPFSHPDSAREVAARRQDLEALHTELEARIQRLQHSSNGHKHRARHAPADVSAAAAPTAPSGVARTPSAAASQRDAAAALSEIEQRIHAKLDDLAQWTVKATALRPQAGASVSAMQQQQRAQPGKASPAPVSMPSHAPPGAGEGIGSSGRKRVMQEDGGSAPEASAGSGAQMEDMPLQVLEILSACKRRNAGQKQRRGGAPRVGAQAVSIPQQAAQARAVPVQQQQQQQQQQAVSSQQQQQGTKHKLEEIDQMIGSKIQQMSNRR